MELTIDQAIQDGVSAHNQGDIEKAERIYRVILEAFPNHPDANHNLGLIAVSLNHPAKAVPLFKAALDVNSTVEQFWLSYIDALIKCNQIKDAKLATKKAKQNGIDNRKLKSLYAQISPQSKRSDKSSVSKAKVKIKVASEARQKTNDAKVDNNVASPSYLNITRLLNQFQNGHLDDAEQSAIDMSEKFPDHPVSFEVLGGIYLQTGRLPQLVAVSERMVAKYPRSSQAHSNLGLALQEIGNLQESELSFNRALELQPDFSDASINLGVTLKKLGRFDDAESIYRQSIALNPNYAKTHFNLGNLLRELSKFEEAVASFRLAIVLDADHAGSHLNLGVTLQVLGELSEAEMCCRQALLLKPDLIAAHNNLAIILKKQGKIEEAIETYKEALAIQPNDSDLLQDFSATKAVLVPNWHIPMMNENSRNEAYLRALQCAIRGGESVLDIGTGAGLLSMMAADCGAKEIVTCEMSKTISKMAEKIITKNGFKDKITVFNKNSKDLRVGSDIPGKADILVSEILSSEFVGEGIQSTILDAKQRLLKENGKMIPQGGSIIIALLEDKGQLSKEIFIDKAMGYDISDFNDITTNKHLITLENEPVFLSDPIEVFTFDFCNFEEIYRESKSIKIKVNKTGYCAGLIQWLKVDLFNDVEYQNHPIDMHRSNSVSGWKTPIFKFKNPIKVEKDELVDIQAILREDSSWFQLNADD